MRKIARTKCIPRFSNGGTARERKRNLRFDVIPSPFFPLRHVHASTAINEATWRTRNRNTACRDTRIVYPRWSRRRSFDVILKQRISSTTREENRLDRCVIERRTRSRYSCRGSSSSASETKRTERHGDGRRPQRRRTAGLEIYRAYVAHRGLGRKS